MPAHEVLATTFDNIAPIGKWQQRFLTILFTTIFALRGRINFTNMARYSPLHEHTFRRQFENDFHWLAFNHALIKQQSTPGEQHIGVFDCSFIRKSGRCTYGLDRFWSGCEGRTQRGLEISLLGCISVERGQAFALDVVQTPSGLSRDDQAPYSRMDFYMEQFLDSLDQLQEVRYMVADGEYARRKPFLAVTGQGKHLITKLRSDANLRYFADGKRAPGQKGPTPTYAGKVNWQDLSGTLARFDYVDSLADHRHIQIYTQVLNSPHFKRTFRVVVLLNTKTQQYIILASTDVEQEAGEVVAYYRLRFQVEFLFRDAKQFTGLEDCQARSEAKLDFHFNMSLAAVNLARLEMSEQGCGFNSYVRLAYNRFLVSRLFEQLGLESEYDLNHPGVQQVLHVGRMAA
jgi:hypothetical protein